MSRRSTWAGGRPRAATRRPRGDWPRSTTRGWPRTIRAANEAVLATLTAAHPVLVDCRPAREVMGLEERVVLHAGPPLAWARACPTMQAAVLCAIRYEGWAADDAAARALVERGEVTLAPCHHRGAVGPMTGLITASMPVFVVENRRRGNRAFATINEGLGRCSASAPTTRAWSTASRWLAAEAGPLLGAALRAGGGIDLRAADGAGPPHGRRDAPAQRRRLRAPDAPPVPPLARATADAGVIARSPTSSPATTSSS